jgi:uncharacterized protein (DUF2062 family)
MSGIEIAILAVGAVIIAACVATLVGELARVWPRRNQRRRRTSSRLAKYGQAIEWLEGRR